MEKAVEILSQVERSQEDIEWLSLYLSCLETFREHTKDLNRVLKNHLCRQLSLYTLKPKEEIYSKGEESATFYIILQGSVHLYNEKHSMNLQEGSQFGDRELLSGIPRIHTAMATKPSYLLVLSKAVFMQILGPSFENLIASKLNFVNNFLPFIRKSSKMLRENAAYALHLEDLKRGDVVINEGLVSDRLFFTFEGETAISIHSPNKIKRNVVSLGVGSCFAEESVFFGNPCKYTIRVSSEYAKIAYFTREEMLSFLPEHTLKELKTNFELKKQGRELIIKSEQTPTHNTTNSQSFPRASPTARDNLMNFIKRNRATTPRKILNNCLRKFGDFKNYLRELRKSPPKARICKSPMPKKQISLENTRFSRVCPPKEKVSLIY